MLFQSAQRHTAGHRVSAQRHCHDTQHS